MMNDIPGWMDMAALDRILGERYRLKATPRELELYALADRIRRAFEVCR